MIRTRSFLKFSTIALLALTVACTGDDSSTDYDPNWGDDQMLPGGKGDFLDLAPVLEFDDAAKGTVDSRQLDVYKITLTNGDKIRLVKDVTDGDLAPDFTLFRGSSSPIRSDEFDVSSKKLTKDYTITSSGDYLIAVRAFRNQGSGAYSLLATCTGGPCNGEFVDPPVDDGLDVADRESCIAEAFDCAFEVLPSKNGRVGETTARNILNSCLADKGVDGLSCAKACEDDSDATDLCNDIVRSLPFYADQPQECHFEVQSCMSDCTDIGFDGSADELWSAPVSMCWMNGFNGNCDSFARKMTSCGGVVANETAVCYEACWAGVGVWNDDLDVMCEEDCGACGVECTRQIEAQWGGITVPSTGLVGDAEDVFMGEMDPFVVGDVCVLFVRVYAEGDGELAPGLYGLVEDLDTGCAADRFERSIGEAVHAEGGLDLITNQDQIDALKRFNSEANYIEFTGEIDSLDLF